MLSIKEACCEAGSKLTLEFKIKIKRGKSKFYLKNKDKN
jgi:hypothetical protein